MQKVGEEDGLQGEFRLALGSSYIHVRSCLFRLIRFSGGLTVDYRITKRMRLFAGRRMEELRYRISEASFPLCDEFVR